MSIESLLLLALFVLLPIIEQLVRLAKQRAAGHTPTAPPRSPEVTTAPPPLPAVRSAPPSQRKPAKQIRPRPMPAEPLPLPVRPTRRETRRSPADALRSARGLRRAVVLMTILGPCRAVDPA